ncbi:2-alkenal reductase [Anaeromyxobacter dehalogenans 2CP-1]|uniref:Chaperone protein DnaK n=1 Tax=Anaeromyxobacter dehalogenans (strain ATCC BAA-258 / DSM 21875 / 2CP-1) TaxID=455488 RepID=B8JBD0_ANAD2|nr:TIGR02266 family protein [Anaeromyxobacter dehalogenans]ACL65757.1 2-alkenal reductase [Anaeromyxobacter dehalogenans 2CP-1]
MPQERRDPRVPVLLRIRLAYGSVDEFVDRFALNVSRGGLFVRTLEPQPPGTPLRLDVVLESGDQVIHGSGVVRWSTPPSAPGEPARVPGMGIKFVDLSPESRALVDRLVAGRGGAAQSDEPPRPAAPPARPPAAPAPAAARSPGAPGPAPRVAAPPPGRPPGVPAPVTRAAAPPPGHPPGVPAVRPASAAAPSPAPAPPSPTSPPSAASPAPPAKARGPVIGIDLGTTNSCVAVVRGGKPEVLASRQGYRTLPSVVAYDAQGRLLVAHAAKAQMVVNPRNTVYGSKRLVGRPFASPTVQACRDRFHYEIVPGPDGAAAVRFAGRDFSLQQIAALILREMRETAAQALGAPVEHAVITVPAYYNDHQRNAVREAGRLAGLAVDRIVNEPTAAALAFGFGKGLDKRVLVYDLGGGTFDASVLEIQGDVYEVISTGGDTFLGGVDFDAQLLDHLVWRFMEEHGFAPPEDRVVWQRIRDAAEETKVALSTREVAVAQVPYLCKDRGGKDVGLEVTVTRAELEALTERLVDRTLEVCREVLGAKGLGPGDVDEVLLVGGQSRMPLVWRKIQEALGREPNRSVHPDEAVALGAALLADSAHRIDSVVLIDALAMGIGVGLPGGRMAPVFPRNTRLPAKKAHEHSTTRDGQTELELQVFQGDSVKASECEYLGTVRVEGLPARPRGEVRVAVEFALGAEGILTVTARDLATGQVTAMQLATLDTPESLRQKLDLPEPQTAPRGARPLERAPHPRPPAPAPPAATPRQGLFGRMFGSRK